VITEKDFKNASIYSVNGGRGMAYEYEYKTGSRGRIVVSNDSISDECFSMVDGGWFKVREGKQLGDNRRRYEKRIAAVKKFLAQ
jgi:hypothetical protein